MDLLADVLDICRPVQAVAKDHIWQQRNHGDTRIFTISAMLNGAWCASVQKRDLWQNWVELMESSWESKAHGLPPPLPASRHVEANYNSQIYSLCSQQVNC